MKLFRVVAVSLALACGGGVPPGPRPDGGQLPADSGARTELNAGAPADSGTAATADAGQGDAGAAADAGPPRCVSSGDRLSCERRTLQVDTGQLQPRAVHFQVPTGAAPAQGFPVALLFQGSFFSAALSWSAQRAAPFGGYVQVQLVQSLLESGFAVLTPEAQLSGSTFWDTNVFPWSTTWESSQDHQLMLKLFSGIAAGSYGPLDPARLYASGISSGGYMTSRMALSYPGKFKALAIASGSWATCSGVLCVLPGTLPALHPPTLFLHGELDITVPISTMRAYDTRLRAQGFSTRVVTDPAVGHAWTPAAATEVRDWFLAHP